MYKRQGVDTGIQLSENWVTPIGIPIKVEMMMAMNLSLIHISEKQLGTRADATETESINKLTLLYYNSSNKYLSKEDCTCLLYTSDTRDC